VKASSLASRYDYLICRSAERVSYTPSVVSVPAAARVSASWVLQRF
jgi:hypothetical protein